MIITEKISEEPAGDEQLAQLQREIGFPIPASYREFLKAQNGGRPAPAGFEFRKIDGTIEMSSVHYFLLFTVDVLAI